MGKAQNLLDNINFKWIRENILPRHRYLTKLIEQERFVQGFLEGYIHAREAGVLLYQEKVEAMRQSFPNLRDIAEKYKDKPLPKNKTIPILLCEERDMWFMDWFGFLKKEWLT